jgi:SRSO17 transposase
MVCGLLMELDDHNCWTMAEAAGHPGPYRMQHLLSRARCDDQGILDCAADWAAGHLSAGDQDGAGAVLIVDETGDAKSSTDCAGAARQYSGTLGGIALCQVAVTLTVAGPAGHALIGRALYLSEDWAADEERRELAGVPDEVMFETKPQLAGRLLQHAHDLGIRAAFVAGDEVYGGLDLRKSIRGRGTGYVLAVRSNYPVTLPSGRRLAVKDAAKLARPATWQRMRTGSATKGAKDYHWAMIEVTPDDTPDGHEPGHAVLLLRRHRYTGTVSYFLCWTPDPVPLATLIAVAVTRWRIEEDHQLGNRPPGSTAARSPPGPPGTAGPRSPCSPTPSSPSQPPASGPATGTPANSGSSPSPSLSCCESSAVPSSPSPAATSRTALPGRYGGAATSTRPSKPTNAGTPTPTRCRNRNELQLPYQCAVSRFPGWNDSAVSVTAASHLAFWLAG